MMDSTDKEILNRIQREVPLEREPFEAIGRELGIERILVRPWDVRMNFRTGVVPRMVSLQRVFQAWQFAVPFLAQNQLILRVIRGEAITMQMWAIYVAAGLGLAALLWFGAVQRSRQERVAIAG